MVIYGYGVQGANAPQGPQGSWPGSILYAARVLADAMKSTDMSQVKGKVADFAKVLDVAVKTGEIQMPLAQTARAALVSLNKAQDSFDIAEIKSLTRQGIGTMDLYPWPQDVKDAATALRKAMDEGSSQSTIMSLSSELAEKIEKAYYSSPLFKDLLREASMDLYDASGEKDPKTCADLINHALDLLGT